PGEAARPGGDGGASYDRAAHAGASRDPRIARRVRAAARSALGQPQRRDQPDHARACRAVAGPGRGGDTRWRRLPAGTRIDDRRFARGPRVAPAASWSEPGGRAGGGTRAARAVIGRTDRSAWAARAPLFAG